MLNVRPRGATLLSVLAGSVCLAITSQASAFLVHIDPAYGSTESTGASASLEFNFAADGDDTVMTMSIDNTTPSSIGSTLVGIAFNLPTAVDDADMDYDPLLSTFTEVFEPADAPPYGTFEFGVRNDGAKNFVGGKATSGLREDDAPQDVQFTFSKPGTQLDPSVLEAEFMALFASVNPPHVFGRFQQVGPDGKSSDKVLGKLVAEPDPGPGPAPDPDPEVTPEPLSAALAMLGLGVLGLGRRRRHD